MLKEEMNILGGATGDSTKPAKKSQRKMSSSGITPKASSS